VFGQEEAAGVVGLAVVRLVSLAGVNRVTDPKTYVLSGMKFSLQAAVRDHLRETGRAVAASVLVGPGDGPEIEAFADVGAVDPAAGTERRDEIRQILEAVAELDELSRRAVVYYFGLADGEAKSESQVASVLGVSRVRVNRAILEAMDRLRVRLGATPPAGGWRRSSRGKGLVLVTGGPPPVDQDRFRGLMRGQVERFGFDPGAAAVRFSAAAVRELYRLATGRREWKIDAALQAMTFPELRSARGRRSGLWGWVGVGFPLRRSIRYQADIGFENEFYRVASGLAPAAAA